MEGAYGLVGGLFGLVGHVYALAAVLALAADGAEMVL